MQFHAVKAGAARTLRGLREQRRQRARELADVAELHVRDPLARAVLQGLEFAWLEDACELRGGDPGEPRPHLALISTAPAAGEAVSVGDDEELAQEALRVGPAADAEEIDDLNEKARLTAARLPHRGHQLRKSRNEALIPDTQQWPARDVADARGLHHQRRRAAACEAAIPLEHLRRHHAIGAGAPGNHG